MRNKDSDFVNGVTQKSHHCCVRPYFLLDSLLFYWGSDPTMSGLYLMTVFMKHKVNDDAVGSRASVRCVL